MDRNGKELLTINVPECGKRLGNVKNYFMRVKVSSKSGYLLIRKLLTTKVYAQNAEAKCKEADCTRGA
jgi:hypothetical protein